MLGCAFSLLVFASCSLVVGFGSLASSAGGTFGSYVSSVTSALNSFSISLSSWISSMGMFLVWETSSRGFLSLPLLSPSLVLCPFQVHLRSIFLLLNLFGLFSNLACAKPLHPLIFPRQFLFLSQEVVELECRGLLSQLLFPRVFSFVIDFFARAALTCSGVLQQLKCH